MSGLLLRALELVGVAACDHLKLANHPLSLTQELILNGGALFLVCMVCHGELVRLKPSPRYLTEFYLLIAAGGALGGMFVGILAPMIFKVYLEWKVGMAVSFLLAAGLLFVPRRSDRWRWIRYLVVTPLGAAGLFCIVLWEFNEQHAIDRARNFFGAIAVTEDDVDDPAQHAFLLKHGHIIHGCQFVDPKKRHWATTYYGEDSGVGEAVKFLHRSGAIRVGAIGLGRWHQWRRMPRPAICSASTRSIPRCFAWRRSTSPFWPIAEALARSYWAMQWLSLESEEPRRFNRPYRRCV